MLAVPGGIAAQTIVGPALLWRQGVTHREMRDEMDRAQLAAKPAYAIGRRRHRFLRRSSTTEETTELGFRSDHLFAERDRLRLHLGHQPFGYQALCRRQPQRIGEVEHVPGTGIAVHLGRQGHRHAGTAPQVRDLLLGESRDRPLLMAGIRRRRMLMGSRQGRAAEDEKQCVPKKHASSPRWGLDPPTGAFLDTPMDPRRGDGSSGRPPPKGEGFRLSAAELSGSFADLGTLLPLMLGAIAVAGLAPGPVLGGFAIFYLGTAWHYRLPIPVQPMKAMAAVLLTAQVSPAALAASGVIVGAILLILGLTGWITRLSRLVPQSVLAGLQLGLGLALLRVSVGLMLSAPVVAGVTLAVLVAMLALRGAPATVVALAAASATAWALGLPATEAGTPTAMLAMPPLPVPAEIEQALLVLTLPQLSLTFANAIVLTSLLADEYFGDSAAHVTPARLSITTGLANLVLAPFGALPMCHGAGGMAAHHRFGARSGTAPLVLGGLLLLLAVLPGSWSLSALGAIPVAGLGVLLLAASTELALTRRLFDSKPSCWPVIAIAAALTLWKDPFWGMIAGGIAEAIRVVVIRLIRGRARI